MYLFYSSLVHDQISHHGHHHPVPSMDALLMPRVLILSATLPLPHECLPHLAWALITHDRWSFIVNSFFTLGFDISCMAAPSLHIVALLILLRMWCCESGCLCVEVPLCCSGALAPHTRQLLPGYAFPAWALTSNTGQLMSLLGFDTLCWIALYCMDTILLRLSPHVGCTIMWIPSSTSSGSLWLLFTKCGHVGFRIKWSIRKWCRENGSLFSWSLSCHSLPINSIVFVLVLALFTLCCIAVS